MKFIFSILLIIFLALLCPSQVSLSKSTKRTLIVELLIPEKEVGQYPFRHSLKVPEGHDFKESLIGGGWALTNCSICRLAVDYQFFVVKSEVDSPETTIVGIDAKFAKLRKCNSQREFKIYNSRKNSAKLKCGVKVIAYYETTNIN